MNREIKFRAKRLDNGEWIEGYYFEHWGKSYMAWGMNKNLAMLLEVDLATVGQYTGMKDSEGKEIYEGDVLNKQSHWGHYVGFDDGAFVAIPTNKVQRINRRPYRLKQEDIDGGWFVTGNIHDNPELLEGGDNQ